MRLVLGKVLLLTGLISLGCGISYIAFKRMLPELQATPAPADNASLAAATDLSETAPRPVEAIPAEQELNPFALTEPAVDEAELLAASTPETQFLFETPESPGAVTPVSYRAPADSPQGTVTTPSATNAPTKSSPTSPSPVQAGAAQPAPAKTAIASNEAEVMFFNPGASTSSEDPANVV
ncbi:MAG: hypothetical protein RLZZ458_856, partial [Planctomycetota bacterium]